MRVSLAIIAALLMALFFAACDQVIELDKNFSNAEGSTDQKDSNSDGTGGTNPAEDIAEGADSPGNQTYNDSAMSDNTVSDAAVPYTDEEDWNGADSATMADETSAYDDSYDELDDMAMSDSDPTATFSATDCGCGENPAYAPICCDGVTTVFNTCFANCINVHTGQCATQQEGTCATQGGENDSDADTEVNDDDTINVGACGCVPADMNAWCCDDGVRYISQCTATCECAGTAALCD